jgi:hypothetical protein
MQDNRRKYFRAPLSTWALFVSDSFVHKARVQDISEGGILLECLPIIPKEDSVVMMIDLPHISKLDSLNSFQIHGLKDQQYKRDILRIEVSPIRVFEAKSYIDQLFTQKIAMSFVHPFSGLKEKISDYVSTYTQNLVYLMNLIEASHSSSDKLSLLREVAFFLGYDKDIKISVLRSQISNDYSQLESN